jgi:opacity protein-like surface antigen
MKTRILAAIAIAVALPTVAQANSAVEQRHFDQQSEALSIEQTAQYHALPTRYSVGTVDGGHSDAADQSLKNVAESTQLSTDVQPSHNGLIGEGQSDAAGQALQNATQTVSNDKGNVEVNFASL